MSIELGVVGKEKKKLVLLLVTIIGFLFSILPIKFNTPFNIFIPGIILLIIPVIYLLIWNNGRISRSEEIFLLSLIMLTIFFNHYIFAIRFGYPLGLDAHYTLEVTRSFLSESGKIDFGVIFGTTFGFPGLYILYVILQDFSGLDLNTLATYIPPAINMLSFVLFYFFVRRFFEPRLSLLAVFVCGWEHTVFKFGFEYRTQSLAIVMYIAILALIAFTTKPIESTLNKKEQESNEYYGNDIRLITLILVLVGAIMITHFVTIIVFLITSLSMYFSYSLANKMNWKADLKISLTLITISFILFIAYMMYMGHFFGGVVDFMAQSSEESLAGEPFGPKSKAPGLIAGLYGPFVFWVTWLIRIIFIGSGIAFFQKHLLKEKKASGLFVLSWMGILLLLILFIAVKGHELNPGRIYSFFAFPFSILIAFGLIYLVRMRISIPKSSIKLFISIFLILFVIASLLKLPNSIIGDTEPFRGYQSVDDIHWEQWEGNNTRTSTAIMNNENGPVPGG